MVCSQLFAHSARSDLACKMALKAVATVMMDTTRDGRKEIDIKRYAKVEKVSLP